MFMLKGIVVVCWCGVEVVIVGVVGQVCACPRCGRSRENYGRK